MITRKRAASEEASIIPAWHWSQFSKGDVSLGGVLLKPPLLQHACHTHSGGRFITTQKISRENATSNTSPLRQTGKRKAHTTGRNNIWYFGDTVCGLESRVPPCCRQPPRIHAPRATADFIAENRFHNNVPDVASFLSSTPTLGVTLGLYDVYIDILRNVLEVMTGQHALLCCNARSLTLGA